MTDETVESILPLVQRIPGWQDAFSQEDVNWMKEDYEITDGKIMAFGTRDRNESDDEASAVEPLKECRITMELKAV